MFDPDEIRREAADKMHTAMCQAVALLNRAPEVAQCAEGREARDILRQALAVYADAYMEHLDSKGRTTENKIMSHALDVVTLTGEEYGALCYEIEDLRNVLRKLVEHGVTYWDNQGEVRHDVGTTQAEAMAVFREARQLLTPNDGGMTMTDTTRPCNLPAHPPACTPLEARLLIALDRVLAYGNFAVTNAAAKAYADAVKTSDEAHAEIQARTGKAPERGNEGEDSDPC